MKPSVMSFKAEIPGSAIFGGSLTVAHCSSDPKSVSF